MALQLSYTTSTGVMGNYWKVMEICFNVDKTMSRTVVGLYISTTSNSNGNDPIYIRCYDWNLSNYPYTLSAMNSNNPVTIAYTKLKTLSEFSGYTDVA